MCIYIERDRETQGGGSSNGGGWVKAVGESKLTLLVMLNTVVSTTKLLGLWTHPQTRWPNLGYDGRQTIDIELQKERGNITIRNIAIE